MPATLEAMSHDARTVAEATAEPEAATGDAAVEGGSGGGRFTSQGAIPPVARAAAAPSASSPSDRAFGVPGGERNVDMDAVNTRHRANVDGAPQASRVAIGGHHETRLKAEANVYSNDGNIVGHAGKGAIQTNAGAISSIRLVGADGKLAKHGTTCVLTHGSTPGWIPVADFDDSSELKQIQHDVAHAIDHDRDAHADLAKDGRKYTVNAKNAPEDIAHLYTKPHEVDPGSNQVAHYFARPGGVVNVLVNLPTWSAAGGEVGERFGIAIDIAHEGATFHETGETAKIPLFHGPGKHDPNEAKTVAHLEFVYGYIENNTGEKRLGWVPKDVLTRKS